MPTPNIRVSPQSLWFVPRCVLLSLLLFAPLNARADSTITISVDTSAISGTSAQLAFDFIDGGTPSNTITVSSFTTDGTLGSPTLTGGASGLLPGTVTLTDSSFFSEYLTNITLGTQFSFTFGATSNGPDATSLPDAFSLFLLDPITGLPLFSTTDPTGSGALFVLNIDGTSGGALDVYSAPGGEAVITVTPITTTPVPEPSSLLLLGVGVGYLYLSLGSLRVLCEVRRHFRIA